MNKTPKAWTQAGTKKVEASTKVTARIDMSAEVAGAGLCPECRRPMEEGYANGVLVKVCHADRIAIPMPDPVEASPDADALAQVTPGIPDVATFGPTTCQSPV